MSVNAPLNLAAYWKLVSWQALQNHSQMEMCLYIFNCFHITENDLKEICATMKVSGKRLQTPATAKDPFRVLVTFTANKNLLVGFFPFPLLKFWG